MRILKYSIIILIAIAAIGIGAYFHAVNSFTSSSELERTADEVTEREGQPLKSSYEDELEMPEKKVQVYIHHMTHQHVVADKKWGNVPSSPQNIENLLTIVLANHGEYKYSEYYVEVLEQWKEGDFSNAVDVHNTIWRWHGGTVGKATGLINEK